MGALSHQVSVNEELDPALVIERLSTENSDLRAELRCVVPGGFFAGRVHIHGRAGSASSSGLPRYTCRCSAAPHGW